MIIAFEQEQKKKELHDFFSFRVAVNTNANE